MYIFYWSTAGTRTSVPCRKLSTAAVKCNSAVMKGCLPDLHCTCFALYLFCTALVFYAASRPDILELTCSPSFSLCSVVVSGQCTTVQCSAVYYSVVQCSTVQYSVAHQFTTVQCGVLCTCTRSCTRRLYMWRAAPVYMYSVHVEGGPCTCV